MTDAVPTEAKPVTQEVPRAKAEQGGPAENGRKAITAATDRAAGVVHSFDVIQGGATGVDLSTERAELTDLQGAQTQLSADIARDLRLESEGKSVRPQDVIDAIQSITDQGDESNSHLPANSKQLINRPDRSVRYLNRGGKFDKDVLSASVYPEKQQTETDQPTDPNNILNPRAEISNYAIDAGSRKTLIVNQKNEAFVRHATKVKGRWVSETTPALATDMQDAIAAMQDLAKAEQEQASPKDKGELSPQEKLARADSAYDKEQKRIQEAVFGADRLQSGLENPATSEDRDAVVAAVKDMVATEGPYSTSQIIRKDETTRYLNRQGREWQSGLIVVHHPDETPGQNTYAAVIKNVVNDADKMGDYTQKEDLAVGRDGTVTVIRNVFIKGEKGSDDRRLTSTMPASKEDVVKALQVMQELYDQEEKPQLKTASEVVSSLPVQEPTGRIDEDKRPESVVPQTPVETVAAGQEKRTRVRAESVPPDGAKEVKIHRNGQYLDVKAPMKTGTFSFNGKEPKQLPVYAEFSFHPAGDRGDKPPLRVSLIGKTAEVGKKNSEKDFAVLIYRETEDGVEIVEKPIPVDAEGWTNVRNADYAGGFILSHKGEKLLFEPNSVLKGEWEAIVPEQKRMTKVKNMHRRIKGNPERRRKVKRGTALAGVALAAGLMHGGPVDMVMDTQHDAKSHVLQMGQDDLQRTSGHDSKDWEARGFGPNYVDEEWKGVAQTMQDLDTHSYDKIHQRATEYKKAHADQFIPRETTRSTMEAIDAAQTTQDVLNVVNPALKSYDKSIALITEKQSESHGTITPYQDKDLDALKKYSKNIVQTLSVFPKELLSDMDVKTFKFADDMGSAGGHYDASDEAIVISLGAGGGLLDTLSDSLQSLDYFDPQSKIIHELAHSFRTPSLKGSDTGQESMLKYGEAVVKDQVFRNFWGSPQNPSIYGAIGGEEEKRAERYRHVLQGDIANPDSVREFNAPENTERIKILASLDSSYGEGFVDYLIDQNDNNSENHRTKGELVMLALVLYAFKKRTDAARDKFAQPEA